MGIGSIIAANLQQISQQVASACDRADRDPAEVKLVAVTKYAELDWVRALYELGHRRFGESRPQQLAERTAELPDDIEWHLIGHLQRNKVKPVLETGAIIHSVESEKLLDRIERLSKELNVSPQLFLEVNVSGEDSKQGFSLAEVRELIPRLDQFACDNITGLMTMAPHTDDPEEARPIFRQLRELHEELNTQQPLLNLDSLSMGMSGDFTVAIEEGATHIRIGSAIFAGLET